MWGSSPTFFFRSNVCRRASRSHPRSSGWPRLRAGRPAANRDPRAPHPAGTGGPPGQPPRPRSHGRGLRGNQPVPRAIPGNQGVGWPPLRARGVLAGPRTAAAVDRALAPLPRPAGPGPGRRAGRAPSGGDRRRARRRARDAPPGGRDRVHPRARRHPRGPPGSGLGGGGEEAIGVEGRRDDETAQHHTAPTRSTTMAGSTEMLAAFRELTTTKQLERSDLLELLRDGIQAALVRKFGPNVRFELNVDELQGTIKVVRLRQVVEAVEDSSWQIALEEARYEDPDFQVGDMLEEEVPFVDFGRLAVQAAKQRIIQRVREGERARIRDEFASKVGELLSGEVQQIERGKLVVMLNKFREAEAIIPYREQNHREHFHQGEPIRAVLKRVEETPKGPRLILTRGDPLFVKALFKLEVPEIQQNIVDIRAAAREVGSRTKIAVFSRDDSIDPVGACVGLKGSRVQAVVNELNGERIDIVPWSPDPERFAKLALAPAKVARVFSDPAAKTIQAVVDEDQLSLAIGRNGQNVRLASELTEWKIELYSSREWMERGTDQPIFAPLPTEETVSSVNPRLAELEGMQPATVAVLEEAGYRTLDDIIDLEREDFLRLPGIAPEEADRLMAIINELTTDEAPETGDEAVAATSADSEAGTEMESEGGSPAGDV